MHMSIVSALYLLHNLLFSKKVINHSNHKCLIHWLTIQCSGSMTICMLFTFWHHEMKMTPDSRSTVPGHCEATELQWPRVSECQSVICRLQQRHRQTGKVTERHRSVTERHRSHFVTSHADDCFTLRIFFHCGIPTTVLSFCFNKLLQWRNYHCSLHWRCNYMVIGSFGWGKEGFNSGFIVRGIQIASCSFHPKNFQDGGP